MKELLVIMFFSLSHDILSNDSIHKVDDRKVDTTFENYIQYTKKFHVVLMACVFKLSNEIGKTDNVHDILLKSQFEGENKTQILFKLLIDLAKEISFKQKKDTEEIIFDSVHEIILEASSWTEITIKDLKTRSISVSSLGFNSVEKNPQNINLYITWLIDSTLECVVKQLKQQFLTHEVEKNLDDLSGTQRRKALISIIIKFVEQKNFDNMLTADIILKSILKHYINFRINSSLTKL